MFLYRTVLPAIAQVAADAVTLHRKTKDVPGKNTDPVSAKHDRSFYQTDCLTFTLIKDYSSLGTSTGSASTSK